MEESKHIKTVISGAADPGQWLTAYFDTRAHLAACESDFRCDPACTRPGCKIEDLPVPVSLIDLMGAARHRQEPVAAVFRRHYGLGLMATEGHDWIRKVTLRLNKPCPFLENDLCTIYPVRPLACILFPEYLVCEGRFAEEAGKDHFRDFRCMQGTIPLSPKRAEIVRQLKKMWEREILISHYYLFHHGQCYLDFSNQIAELVQAAGTLKNAEAPGASTVPNRVMEQCFQEHSAGCPTFAGVEEKLERLDGPEGQRRFLELLQDEALVKKLRGRGEDRDLIFRIVKGRLKATRRSLVPREYGFY